MYREIKIRSVRRPHDSELEDELQWLCNSLGLCAGRDTDKVSQRVLQEFLRNFSRSKEPVASEKLANELNLNAARVNHHIRSLIDSGFLYREKKRVVLRGGNLRDTIEEIKKDTDRVFADLINIAEEIDKEMGLNKRG